MQEQTMIATSTARPKLKSDRTKINASYFETNFVLPSFPKSKAEIEFIDSSIIGHFIFESLNHDERVGLIDAMESRTVKNGTVLIEQNDEHIDYFYLVASGKLEKTREVNGSVTSSEILEKGETFGGLALLFNCPRIYSVTSLGECKLWKLEQRAFKSFLVMGEEHKTQKLRGILCKVDFLKDLADFKLKDIIDTMFPQCFDAGEQIIRKGEIGDTFYIIQTGCVKIHDIGNGDSQYVDQNLGNGDFFGARALLTGESRWMNATATTSCVLLELSRRDFEATIGDINKVMNHSMKKRHLKEIPIFGNSSFTPIEMDKLADELTPMEFKSGEDLSDNMHLYIIIKGSVVITQLEQCIIHILKSGDHFGGCNLQEEVEVPRQTAIVEEDLTCHCISKDQILKIIGNINRLGKPILPISKKFDPSILLSHVNKIRILGQGSFGRVWLATVENKDPTFPFALKMLNKRNMICLKKVKDTLREKNIMASIDHSFLANINATFQDDLTLYILQHCLQGGELYNVIHPPGGASNGLLSSDARFYAACVLEALAYLHSHGIIFRDLKPENILLNKEGYAVLIDFGYAKIVQSETYTLCGTPEFIAPEVLRNKGYGKGCDYWSFGVLICEMLTGYTPFNPDKSSVLTTLKRIIKRKYYFSPKGRSATDTEGKDLFLGLISPKPKRLGCLSGGAQDIRDHAWLTPAIDFTKLNRMELQAPWQPDLRYPMDVDEFHSSNVEEHVYQSPLTNEEQEMFKDF